MKKLMVFILGLIISIAETWTAIGSFEGSNPFPWDEVLYTSADHVIRDVLALASVWFVYKKRNVIVKAIKDFLPVFVIGILYLFAAAFMMYRLSLDFGLQTFLSVFAGLTNNVVIVLLIAGLHYKYRNTFTKVVYFISYVFTGAVIIGDMVYFWQTTMHVESVLFQN